MSRRVGVARALRHQAIRRLLAAFACLMAAEWALIAALSVHAYHVDGALAVGLLGLRFVPAAIVGLAAPRLIERRQPAAVLRAVGAVRALLVAVIAGVLFRDAPFGAVLAVVALDGAVSALYRPAQSALLPSLAGTPGELTAAAGLLGNVKTLSQVTGAFVGGLAVLAVSTASVAAAAAVAMAVAAALVPSRTTRVRVLDKPRPPAPASTAMRMRALNIAGLAAVRALLRGLWLAMVVVVALQLLGLGAGGVGLLMAASAAGAIIALPIALRLFGSSRLAGGLGVALVAAAAPIAGLAAWDVPAVALTLVAIHGIGMAVAEAASLGLLHRLLDARGVASLVGPMESAKLGFEGAGSLLAPALLAVVGTRSALAAVGAVPVVLVALDWRALKRIDAAAGARTRLVDLLRQVDIFRGLPMAGLEEIAAGAEPARYAAGTDVIRQGEEGETFFVIGKGRAQVLMDGYQVAILDRGMGFGERALLRGGRRAATIRAVGELEVVAITRDVFLSAVAGGQRLAAPERDASARSLAELLPSLPLFARLPAATMRQALDRFEVAEFAPDAVLVRQGEAGDCYYVLLAGSADVLVDGRQTARLVAGDGFGEIALLHDVPRRATVQACGSVRVAALGRDAFAELVQFDAPALA